MKVTVFFVINFLIACFSCNEPDFLDEQLRYQQKLDSTASVAIDSAYKTINRDCDTIIKRRLPELVDSLLKTDTTGSLNVALLP